MTTPAAPTTGPTPNAMPGAAAAAAAQGATPAAPQAPSAPAPPAESPAAAPAAPAQPDAATPPWGDAKNFDPDKAWNLIQNLKGENSQLKSKAAEAQPILDAAEAARRAEQGELETTRQDLSAANGRADTWKSQAVRAKAEAVAAGAKFVDPGDAVTLIGDLAEFVDGDSIDTEKLTGRLNQLAADKPYLTAAAPQRGFTPNPAQGGSGGGPLTASQVAAAAESQGDVKTAISAKSEQLLNLRAQPGR